MKRIEDQIKKERMAIRYAEMQNWTCIVVRNWQEVESSWCLENLEGQWVSMGNYWYFEQEEDITIFALRWS